MTPVNLDNYISWANAQSSGLKRVVLSDEGGTASTVLRNASERLSLRVRFHHAPPSRAMARAVNSDFRDALQARFGNVADQVMDTVLGQKLIDGRSYGTGKLTAHKIKKAVALAARLQNDALRRPAGGVQALANPNLPNGFASARLLTQSPADAIMLQKFADLHAEADRLTEAYPLTPDGLKELNVLARAFTSRQRRLLSEVTMSTRISGGPDTIALTDEANGLRDRVWNHVQQLTKILQDKPISYERVKHSRTLWLESAKNTCITLSNRLDLPPHVRQSLSTLATGDFFKALEAMEDGKPNPKALRQLSPDLQKLVRAYAPDYSRAPGMDAVCPNPDAYVKDLRGQLEKLIRKGVSVSVGSRAGSRLPVKDVLMHELEKTLNRQPWTTVSKEFTATIGHEQLTVGSVITPAKQLGPAMRTVYSDVNGVMSHSYDETRAVNLNASELTLTDSTGTAQVAFRGIRHGVHCALAVKNDTLRSAANLHRAEITARAALLSRPDLIQAALNAPNRTIDLPMTSLSLLTPDVFRHGESGEKKMLLEQVRAWDDLNASAGVNGLQVSVPDPAAPGQTVTVTVRPNVIPFNFGVNEGAVGIGAFSYIGGGWHTSDKINKEGMAKMEQRVVGFLRNCRDANKAETVRKLWSQITTVMDSRAEHRDRGDAYKAVSRLAVMSWLMGDVPCWNCKSGKDRTGEMDVECKFLAALIARGEDIPEPGADLTDSQRSLFTSLALLGGNHEIQEYNTTLAGFKTGNVASIARRLGSPEASALHTGAAEYVKV